MFNDKKLFPLLISCVLIFSLSISSTFAADKDNTPGKSFSWSPDCSSWYGYGYSDGTQIVSTNSKFSWTTSAAAEINSMYYTTMEHNIGDGVELNVCYQFSDLPNVYYDTDDDTKDGYYEESEAICLDRVSANTNYTFVTEYEKTKKETMGGYFATYVQRSFLLGEYQTAAFDLLNSTPWNCPAYAASYSLNQMSQNTSDFNTYQAANSESVILHERDLNENELLSYFDNQLDQFNSCPRLKSSTDELTTVTVTFRHPISMDDMLSLVELGNGDLKIYHAKFIDEDDKWYSIGSKIANETQMVDWATDCATSNCNKEINYVGIVSMEITIPASMTTLDYLNNSPLVFGVDLSEYLYKHSDSYDPSATIVVPHYAQEVSMF